MGGIFSKGPVPAGQRRPCTEQVHSGRVQPCAANNCKNIICDNCVQPFPDGKLYCFLCGLSKGGDDLELDQEMVRKSKIKGAKSEFSVKMDTETGEIKGFE